MSGLLTYSGLSTKIRYMKSNLITKDEWQKIIELESINDFFLYLHAHKTYGLIFERIDSTDVHRETLEHYLIYSNYLDYAKLYKFSSISQRTFLKLYFSKHEIRLIKRVMRHLEDSTKDHVNEELDEIFNKYSSIPTDELFKSRNMAELIESLKDTIYYKPLQDVYSFPESKNIDFEAALDFTYFMQFWKKKDRLFNKKIAKILEVEIGTEVDTLNILWIYRSKKYYNLTKASILSFIIPIYHKLKKEEINNMLDSNTLDEFYAALSKTKYAFALDVDNELNFESSYEKLLSSIYKRFADMLPYSLAIVNSYLYHKEDEMKKLITIAECIRYGYDSQDIAKQILIN